MLTTGKLDDLVERGARKFQSGPGRCFLGGERSRGRARTDDPEGHHYRERDKAGAISRLLRHGMDYASNASLDKTGACLAFADDVTRRAIRDRLVFADPSGRVTRVICAVVLIVAVFLCAATLTVSTDVAERAGVTVIAACVVLQAIMDAFAIGGIAVIGGARVSVAAAWRGARLALSVFTLVVERAEVAIVALAVTHRAERALPSLSVARVDRALLGVKTVFDFPRCADTFFALVTQCAEVVVIARCARGWPVRTALVLGADVSGAGVAVIALIALFAETFSVFADVIFGAAVVVVAFRVIGGLMSAARDGKTGVCCAWVAVVAVLGLTACAETLAATRVFRADAAIVAFVAI